MPKKSEKVLSTDLQIKGTKAPAKGRTTFRIDRAPNLVLRVTASGRKSWGYWLKDSKTDRWRMVTIGHYPAISLANAKKEANRLGGLDTFEACAADTNEPPLSFTDLGAQYIERHAKVKKRSWREDARMLKADILPALGEHHAKEVTKADIVALLNRIADRGAPIAANRTLALLRKIFNWAVGEDLLQQTPVQGIAMRANEQSRDRVLSNDELRQFWQALARLEGDSFDPVTADVLRVQLLLGARIREVTGLERRELSLESDPPIWTLPKTRSKSKRAVPRPLIGVALRIIERRIDACPDSAFVFVSPVDPDKPLTPKAPTRAVSRAAVRHEIPAGFTPHDLRRTTTTGLAALGVAERVTEKILGHAPARGNVLASVYDRHSYMEEMAAALELWERRVMDVVTVADPAPK